MSKNIIYRLDLLHQFIRAKTTGSPRELACKLEISERQVRGYISLFRELGAPVRYSRKKGTYYYAKDGSFNFKFIRNENPLPRMNYRA